MKCEGAFQDGEGFELESISVEADSRVVHSAGFGYLEYTIN